jgi:hypothetical protein
MITIGYSTRKHNQEYIDYIQKTCMYKNVEIIEKINDGNKSLSQVYNEIIEESTNDIVILCHDDIEFDTKNWGEKVIKHFRKNPEYGILGLAGTKYLDPNARWWEVFNTMYGIVNHKHEGKKWTSTYSKDIGNKIEEVVVVDGLFIALNKKNIKYRFDESINGFHFYDLGFCLPNYLEKVKIGVMFDVRVTHLSIGQTNEQWEINRINFSEKYKNNLPIDITNIENDNQTFVCVHDQNIILEYEKNNKFSNLKNYSYLFLGNRDIDLIESNPKVIIARNFDNNLEEYPYFTAFTGWYLLWKNNLIKSKYVTLIEYDTVLTKNFNQTISKFIYENSEIIGYVPVSVKNYHFIENPNWVSEIFSAIKNIYNQNIESSLKIFVKNNPNANWSSTSNITFRVDVFNEYMKWFEPLIPHIKESKTSGHAFERSITFFQMTRKKKMTLTKDIIKHIQMDSHKTQNHNVDYEKNLDFLIKNI